MHKNQGNAIGIVRLQEIEDNPCGGTSGFESAYQANKHKIGRWCVVADRVGELRFHRMHFTFNSRGRLLGRATKLESRVISFEIKRVRNRSGDSPGWCEFFTRHKTAYTDERTANARLNVFLLNESFFDLPFKLKFRKVV